MCDRRVRVRTCGVSLVLSLWMSSDLGDWTKEGNGSRI